MSYIGYFEQDGIVLLMKRYIRHTYSQSHTRPDNTLFMQRGSLGCFLNYNDHEAVLPQHVYHSGILILGDQLVPPADVAIIEYGQLEK